MQLAYKSSSVWKRVDFNVNNVLLGEKKSNNDNQLYYIQNIFVCLKKNKIPIYTSFKYKIKNMYMLKKIQLTQLENMLVTLGRDIMSLPWENIFEF